MANPRDKSGLGIKKLIEDVMIERIAESWQAGHRPDNGGGLPGHVVPNPRAPDLRGCPQDADWA
jgi:hypothetical protein